jgi:transaldolase / glucose-6-phosphate isomerase
VGRRLGRDRRSQGEDGLMNPLKALAEHGQSLWLDFLAGRFIADGSLKRLIEEDGLKGVTSNPSIFEKAIGEGGDYDSALETIEQGGDLEAGPLYERLAIADALRPVYEASKRRDGFVSLEVSPYLAHDTAATIAEARRLWRAVARDNLMVKVPGTPAGLPAIRQLLGEGININITLLFSQEVYEQVVDAYLGGLEQLVAGGGDPSRLASVASFFVSRIDTAVDRQIEARLASGDAGAGPLAALRGKIAVANAKLAYRRHQHRFTGERWETLHAKGARPQRLLWASTGTKNPAYSDVLYVEELIGPDTVNTMPLATLNAFRDHGRLRASLEEGVDEAERAMAALARDGIAIDEITAGLVEEGVRLFVEAADKLLGVVAGKRRALLRQRLDGQQVSLPASLQKELESALAGWRHDGNLRRLWARDAALWTGKDEAQWLGWLDIVAAQQARLDDLVALGEDMRREGFAHALLLGMGGSSLGPEVLARSFGRRPGHPELLVLDSTDPAQIRAVERRIDPARTLFIVSSKSGTTLEPDILLRYFFARASAVLGDRAPRHFIAITDPGSALQQTAQRLGFHHVSFGVPSIGGRYSVLSDFGLVPAAVMGLDLRGFLDATRRMVTSCGATVPPEENPGAVLGLVLGLAARSGRDKVTITTTPGIADIGAWLEQLLAESTGKEGKGLVPVDGETLGAPGSYGNDRVFAHLRLAGEADGDQETALAALERAGHPVVRISVTHPLHLGQEFFRWEMAAAVAGAVIGINPFDQPDVEASKVKTRELTAAYEKSGRLPPEKPVLEDAGIALFADPRRAEALAGAARGRTLDAWLAAHLARLQPGDYAALLAYIERNAAHHEALQAMRLMIRDRKHVATCVGFGPRFLHSTGQVYKGGPNSGVFLQITAGLATDLPIPERRYSFGIVEAAQARGDFDVLAARGRRALRVHLGPDVAAGLARLQEAVRRALS